ncbi:MAG: hypothetical protein RMJ53_05195 [Chitinophagales bacterium]|nr:hypothetical protein [Chitinophagales bacterium]MDW8273609.1 hypothetical protein [Chitinophagales bacterium]
MSKFFSIKILAIATWAHTGFLSISAQYIAPYSDFNNIQYVFDDGQTYKIEPQPFRSYSVGKKVLAYIPQNDRLKIYYQGKAYNASPIIPQYFVTDNLFVFRNINSIKVLWENEFKQIEFQFREGEDRLWVSDSLIVWTNSFREANVFYNGIIKRIDDLNMNADKVKLSDNILAYTDISGNFKVFYKGKLQILETYEPEMFFTDRNIVGYLDYQSNWKFFYYGKVYETNINNVKRMYPCEGKFVFISRLNELSVWENGEEHVLLNYPPPLLEVKENMVVYADNAQNFYCYYNGKSIWVERYIPSEWKMDNDILVYKDINGRLKGIYYGKEVEISDQMVQKFNLYNEVVTYSLQPFETKIWCKEKTYTYR